MLEHGSQDVKRNPAARKSGLVSTLQHLGITLIVVGTFHLLRQIVDAVGDETAIREPVRGLSGAHEQSLDACFSAFPDR